MTLNVENQRLSIDVYDRLPNGIYSMIWSKSLCLSLDRMKNQSFSSIRLSFCKNYEDNFTDTWKLIKNLSTTYVYRF